MGSKDSSQPSEKSATLVLPDQILPPNLFVVPMSGGPIYPTLMAPLQINLPQSLATVKEVMDQNRLIGLLLVRSGEPTDQTPLEEMYDVGVVAKVLKRIKLPDGSVSILVHSLKRFRVVRELTSDPHRLVEVEYLDDVTEKTTEMDALMRSVVSYVKKISESNPFFTEEMRLAMINAPSPGNVADLVAFALSLPVAEGQTLLETLHVKKRFEKLLVHLQREKDVADVQKRISDQVDEKVSKAQREFFLREQMKAIKKELGIEEDGKDQASRTFREKIEDAGMPEEVKKVALDELTKFETLSENSPEYNVSRNYLDMLCSLPWSIETKDVLDLGLARKTLDADHYGLDKVKDRILEFLAVRKLKQDRKGSIIVLVGPPGVGKTSIGKSIAKTLGRNFYRFSLGGMRDEAEIKGHRRTYVGALPGKVITAVKRAGSKNSVILLDEIDKLSSSYHGDPASALLEVLDPEQNQNFIDHYLDVPFDLSQVLFIATANTLSTIPGPLLDRMEVIELPGYTLEEKEDIASRYVIPKELETHGLSPSHVRFERGALRRIMQDYAREPGLRTLQQLVGKIARKAAARIVTEQELSPGTADEKRKFPAVMIRESELQSWLGPQRFHNEVLDRASVPGVVVGMAWTSMGGEILFIEATDLPGSGQMKLTGQMGGVMSESASIAWTYVKKRLAREGTLNPDAMKNHDVHLHIPAGGIPKDGPSAGITMAAALYGLFAGRKVKPRLSMTGELSLVGKVLPVGGIKEKVLAAKRAGVKTIIMPALNEKDAAEIPREALDGLRLHFVKHIDEVLDLAFEPEAQAKAKPKRGHAEVVRSGLRRKTAPSRSLSA